MALPSNPYDAKGLLAQAIRDDDPVIFCEHKALYNDSGNVPESEYLIPFGEAAVTRSGTDITVVALSRMVKLANEAADRLTADGISVEVIDPRTTSPLDMDTIYDSVGKTGRLVTVDESNPMCSMASEIASAVACEAFDCLRGPVVKVTAPHTPVPATPQLEQAYVPSSGRIERSIRQALKDG